MATKKAVRKQVAKVAKTSRVADVKRPAVNSRYMQGGANPFFHSWNPSLREQADDVRQSYIAAAARAIDTIQNSGWIAGAIDQCIAMVIGTGLRLSVKPDAEALGWTQDEAQDWARLVERRWESWSGRAVECDIEGKSTIGKLSAQAMRTYFGYGEILATLPYVRRPFNQYGTKVQMLPPSRLLQDTIKFEGLYQGVWRDMYGFPVGYRIGTNPLDGTLSVPNYRDVKARDAWGRPNVIHVFDGHPGQSRGVSPLTPALKVVRQFDQLADATLTSALIQAIFAATIQSPEPTESVLQAFQDLAEQQVSTNPTSSGSPLEAMLEMRAGWYEATQIDLGSHGKIAHLAPGDKLDFHNSNTPNDTYEAFVKLLLREIARCLGVTFEQLTGDYSGATYSSVRMATSETWLLTLYRRVNIVAPFLQPIFEAWLEEEIENGWVAFPGGVPGYLENRALAARAHWRGPAKPQADDSKFANAVVTLRDAGVITDEWICAEMGEDWEDIYEQRKREMDMRKKLGLPETSETAINAGNKVLRKATDGKEEGVPANG